MELFKAENVSFTYPDQKKNALNKLNFSVEAGEFIVLFGASGSGKSTLLRLLKKELTPEGTLEGTITYKGMLLEEIDERTRASKIGFVFQNPEAQIVTDKVWHELAFGLENLGERREVIRRRVGEMANFFGIHNWFHRKTTTLSGGQKQLLNLASVLVMQPEVLLLDEPTAQLDPIAREEFINMLYKLNRQLGITIILVEHILDDVFSYADRVLYIESGTIQAEDTPEKIGIQLQQLEDTPMLQALPIVTKLFYRLKETGKAPLTVREGKRLIDRKFPTQLIVNEPEVKTLSNETPIFESKNIWFRYDRKGEDILRGVDLSVYKGEIFTILGGNGSGKSTLLHTLSGQYKPYRGTVKIKGKKLRRYKNTELYRSILAYLPQDVKTVFLKSTVEEEFNEMKKVLSFPEEIFQKELEQLIERLDLEPLLQHHPFDLSGGEQQKVALTKVLLRKPKILLLDEPTKGMDILLRKELEKLILELQQQGKTIIIVTHDVEFASRVSTRCSLFFDGQITTVDHPKYFFSENTFYTTVANRIIRHLDPFALTVEDIVTLAKRIDVINE